MCGVCVCVCVGVCGMTKEIALRAYINGLATDVELQTLRISGNLRFEVYPVGTVTINVTPYVLVYT